MQSRLVSGVRVDSGTLEDQGNMRLLRDIAWISSRLTAFEFHMRGDYEVVKPGIE
jgi:hypothetical protein